MNQRENLLAIFRREPFEWLPVEFNLCPSLEEEYKRRTGSHLPYQEYFEMPWRNAPDIQIPFDKNRYLSYYPDLKPGSTIDLWGVAHEPGSEAAKHMTYLRSPLRGIDSLQEIMAYPLPDFRGGDASSQKASVEAIHARGPGSMRKYADNHLGNRLVHPRDGGPDDGHDERGSHRGIHP